MLRLMSRTPEARLLRLRSHLKAPGAAHARQAFSEDGRGTTIDIAGVVAPLRSPRRPDLVPASFVERLLVGAGGGEFSPETLGHLRWMLQKDLLGQDMFLLGTPGPHRRHVVKAFAELTNREVEYVAISRDTTESDLKQRRELVGGSSVFRDAPPVRAALRGRLLILDGIEKAERNVLPTLNNLLENREMALDDGRFLMRDTAFDALAKAGQLRREAAGEAAAVGSGGGEGVNVPGRLCRVHPDFRVVALGLPTPPYPGYALDPPLRSRFQARAVGQPTGASVLAGLRRAAPGLPEASAKGLAIAAEATRMLENAATRGEGASDPGGFGAAVFPSFPHWALKDVGAQLAADPAADPQATLLRAWPALLPGMRGPHDQAHVVAARALLDTHLPSSGGQKRQTPSSPAAAAAAAAAAGNGPGAFVSSPALEALLSALLADLRQGLDVCLVGDKGCGKSAVAHELAKRWAAEEKAAATAAGAASPGAAPPGVASPGMATVGGSTVLPLFKDLSARDLLQRRATTAAGATTWEDSPLVRSSSMLNE